MLFRNFSTISSGVTILCFSLLHHGCSQESSKTVGQSLPPYYYNVDQNLVASVPEIKWELVESYDHDSNSFTQGLYALEEYIFESSGLFGQSYIYFYDLEGEKIISEPSFSVSEEVFAEGLTIVDNSLYLLTWQAETGYVYDIDTGEQTNTFSYDHEGWGISHDGSDNFYLSSGLPYLHRYNNAMEFQESIEVYYLKGKEKIPVANLNELEYINGKIYANIWKSPFIAAIDPETGEITGLLDLTSLTQQSGDQITSESVLNGIALVPGSSEKMIYVTGKNWDTLHKLEI